MGNKKCVNCPQYKNCRDSFASWVFFIIGLIATVAIRVVTVLINLDPLYGKIAWYVGVVGFFIFFVYKFAVTEARAKSIAERNLVQKINARESLSAEDYSLVGAILCGLSSNKEKINYFFIFALSGIALALAIYMDFIK
ncbi:MAG: hypothetical protein V1727_04670 [Candidatus Omnitrophota bacterium]